MTRSKPVAERVQLIPGVERPLLRVAPLRVLDPSLAGLTSRSPQLTARASTWRSACVASKRCPEGIVIRQAAIAGSEARSTASLRTHAQPFRAASEASRSSPGSPSCCARYTSTNSASVGDSIRPCSRRLLGVEAAALHTPRAAAPHTVRPPRPIPSLPGEGNHLSLLRHRGTSLRRHRGRHARTDDLAGAPPEEPHSGRTSLTERETGPRTSRPISRSSRCWAASAANPTVT